MCLQEIILVPNTSTSIKTRIATEAYLAEGWVLIEKETLSIGSLIHGAGTSRLTVSKKLTKFRVKVNEVVHPFT
jgi:hypothetical protein